jgi:outer membrane protein
MEDLVGTNLLPFHKLRPVLLTLLLLAFGCATSDPLQVFETRTVNPSIAARSAPSTWAGNSIGNATMEVSLPDFGEPATLPRCIELALESNPKTRVAWAAAQAAAARVGESRAAWLPEASLDLQAGLSGDPVSNVGSATGTELAGRLTIGYLLFDGGARRGRVDEARAHLEAADFRHQTALLDVAVAVEEAYYQLQGAHWYAGVVNDLIRQAEYQYQLANARFEVGLVRRYDVAQAKARLAEAQLLAANAAAGSRQATGALARTMGLDARTTIAVEPLPESDIETSLDRVNQLISLAVEHRPELGSARAQVRASLAATRTARAGHWPTLSATASVAAGTDSRSGDKLPWSAGLGLSVPLFSGFETTYEVRRTFFDEQQAQAELAGLVTDIQFEVWSAHTLVEEAAKTVVATRELVTAAKAAVSLAEENYKGGTGTIGELLDAQASLVTAHLEQVRSRLNWYQGMARLHRAVGTSLRTTNDAMVGGLE